MSARRRRAALSAVGALLVALFCAVLASSVEGDTHRTVLVVLSLIWLVVAAAGVVNLLRTKPAPSPEPSADEAP